MFRCISHDFEDILIFRKSFGNIAPVGGSKSGNGAEAPKKIRKPSSTRKYICPCCGNSFRATKNINVLCMDWNEKFIVVTQQKNRSIKVLFVGTLADWIGSSVAYKYEMKPIRSFRQQKDQMSIVEV